MDIAPEGGRVWHVPDCFLPSRSVGATPSHEAFCVLNVSGDTAQVTLTFYSAEREPLSSQVEVPRAAISTSVPTSRR